MFIPLLLSPELCHSSIFFFFVECKPICPVLNWDFQETTIYVFTQYKWLDDGWTVCILFYYFSEIAVIYLPLCVSLGDGNVITLIYIYFDSNFSCKAKTFSLWQMLDYSLHNFIQNGSFIVHCCSCATERSHPCFEPLVYGWNQSMILRM